MTREDELMMQIIAEVIGGMVALAVVGFFAKLMIDLARREGELSERVAAAEAERDALKRAQVQLNKTVTVEETAASLEQGKF